MSFGVQNAPVVFFEQVHERFLKAEQQAGGPVDRFYAIGGYTIRVRFAGQALVPYFTPALEHLAADPVPEPALTVCCFDRGSTGVEMPSLPWSVGAFAARGEIDGYNDGRIKTHVSLDSAMLEVLDAERNSAVFAVREIERIPYYLIGAPLRIILHWWMQQKGRQLVHAGAVGRGEGGVLLAGRGGSGKSTTSLACLNSKLHFASDDYCLLANEPAPYAYSLYNTAKLDADNLSRFPFLGRAVHNSSGIETEKALFFLHRVFPERVASGFPIRAVLVPRITGGVESRVKPTSPVHALRALAPSTIFQLPGAGPEAFQEAARLVKQVPCYNLELGTDLTRIPEVVLELLDVKGEGLPGRGGNG